MSMDDANRGSFLAFLQDVVNIVRILQTIDRPFSDEERKEQKAKWEKQFSEHMGGARFSFNTNRAQPEQKHPEKAGLLYNLLGLDDINASSEDIKRAYKQIMRKIHPDLHKNDPQLTVLARSVNDAYAVLSDPEKRKAYDSTFR